MYHRAQPGRHGNSADTLDSHFRWLAQHFPCVLPGEPLAEDRDCVSLSFDDAYFDFHHVVHPLLLRHGLRAMLAVAPALIPERTNEGPDLRLARLRRDGDPAAGSPAYCTWPELIELSTSGAVSVAAHGWSHVRLGDDESLLQTEIVHPKRVLEERLGRPVSSFVYPFGRCAAAARAVVARHYRHSFRIGSACNRGWQPEPLYRISADDTPRIESLFSPPARVRLEMRRRWNRVRGR